MTDQVRVIRSQRRKKSSSARLVDNVIEVRIPSWMTPLQERETVAELVARVNRSQRLRSRGTDLTQRASELARAYDLPLPAEIRWVTNQQHRWGSCSPESATIRISSRLGEVPGWVLDFVILHELAHLVVVAHNANFYALLNRYPRAQRAEGFLDAMTLGCAAERFAPS